MRPLPALLAASLLLTTLSSTALAGGPGSVEPTAADPGTPTHTKRYGTQILLGDLAWMGASMLIGSVESQSDSDGDGFASLTGLGYFAIAPIIHLKNGNRSGAAKSLAARALLPIGGMLAGAVIVSSGQDDRDDDEDELFGDDFDVLIGAMFGGMIGVVTAMVVDWTVFAKKTVEGRPASWAVAPSVSVTRHGASAGLAGSF